MLRRTQSPKSVCDFCDGAGHYFREFSEAGEEVHEECGECDGTGIIEEGEGLIEVPGVGLRGPLVPLDDALAKWKELVGDD